MAVGGGKRARASALPAMSGKLSQANGVNVRVAKFPHAAAPKFDPAFQNITAVSGRVIGNPRYHSDESAIAPAVNTICAMVRGMAAGSSAAAAAVAATGEFDAGDVVTADGGARELFTTALETAASNSTGWLSTGTGLHPGCGAATPTVSAVATAATHPR